MNNTAYLSFKFSVYTMLLGDYLYKNKPIEFKKWTRKHYMIVWYSKNRLNKTNKVYKYDIEEHDEYLRWCIQNPRKSGTRGKQRQAYQKEMINQFGEIGGMVKCCSSYLYKGQHHLDIPNLKKETKTCTISFD
tara:strand:+ start:185 stop:583 length:399 start_codon:yes stop_codon:yes gene_type:complete